MNKTDMEYMITSLLRDLISSSTMEALLCSKKWKGYKLDHEKWNAIPLIKNLEHASFFIHRRWWRINAILSKITRQTFKLLYFFYQESNLVKDEIRPD